MLSERRKLLLADNSPTIQKVISLTFEDEGMEVVSASDGAEALRVLEEQRPDILLADVWMPGPNGYELCERVRADARLRHIPVILLASKFEPFNEAEARRVGADTVLTKPFQSIRDLVSRVGSLLGGGGAKQEEAAAEQPRRAEPPAPAAEASPAPAPQAESAAAAPPDEHAETFPPRYESFADLSADDKLIETKPAEQFGDAPHAARSAAHWQTNAAPSEYDAASSFETSHAGAAERAAAREESGVLEHTEEFETAGRSPDVFADSQASASGTNGQAAAAHDERQPNRARPAGESQPAGEGVMAARGSFAARAAGAAAADDALLDLGQFEPRSSRAAAEADDFILDLEEDLHTPPRPAAREADVLDAYVSGGRAAASAEAGAFGQPEAQSVFTGPDEPSAFAEASHGVAASEVVMQDEPQYFASSSAEQAVGSAPRGFVEPSVMPAEEPVPATVEDEFTDGSVEGDVPKPPAFGQLAAPEPPPAGYTVGEARTGVEEAPRAGQLSPEDVDAIARRVVELMSDKVVREIAWEVVPELAELLIKRRLDEERQK